VKWEFHPEAEFEFVEAATRYESEVRGLGERFSSEVERVAKLIVDNPKLGSPVHGKIRYFLLRRFPFSVIYSVETSVIYILAVAHYSREPAYWRARIIR